MNETKPHPVDLVAPILGRYEALEAIIEPGTDPLHIRALLDAINESFRIQCDHLDAGTGP